jgi:MYXO-CTERM domain-containing protein
VARLGLILAALALVVLSGWGALAGMLWGFSLKCDDSCNNLGRSWRDDPDSWQWTALGWSSLALFALALAVLAFVVRRRGDYATAAFAAWVVAATAFFVFFSNSGLA